MQDDGRLHAARPPCWHMKHASAGVILLPAVQCLAAENRPGHTSGPATQARTAHYAAWAEMWANDQQRAHHHLGSTQRNNGQSNLDGRQACAACLVLSCKAVDGLHNISHTSGLACSKVHASSEHGGAAHATHCLAAEGPAGNTSWRVHDAQAKPHACMRSALTVHTHVCLKMR